MAEEAQLYLQLLVGLIDKEGNRYQREDVASIAARHGFEVALASSLTDPALTSAPMISRELLGIWEGNQEPSVLFLQVLPVDQARYREATETFRSLVDSILRELNQDAVYWFPALRKPLEGSFTNFLLRPATITRPEDVEFPDPRAVFGRQVIKTLSLLPGPRRAGQRSLLVYRATWKDSPLFIPNSQWIPPYGDVGQEELIESDLRERYPFARDLSFSTTRRPEWCSSTTKRTGDRRKARTFGEYANYTFQYARIESPELATADPDAVFADMKGRECLFRTIEELLAHTGTQERNIDVLRFIQRFQAVLLPDPSR